MLKNPSIIHCYFHKRFIIIYFDTNPQTNCSFALRLLGNVAVVLFGCSNDHRISGSSVAKHIGDVVRSIISRKPYLNCCNRAKRTFGKTKSFSKFNVNKANTVQIRYSIRKLRLLIENFGYKQPIMNMQAVDCRPADPLLHQLCN